MKDGYLSLEKKAFLKIPEKAMNILKFDSIHLEKLLEISQYSLMSFFLALVVSNYINGLMIKDRIKTRSLKTSTLILKISIYTVLIAIAAKYIPKIVRVLPFLGWWDSHYKPDWHGEATYGIATAMGLAFYTVLYNYFSMVEELSYRIDPKAQVLTGAATQICQNKDGTYTQAYPTCDLLGLKRPFHSVD